LIFVTGRKIVERNVADSADDFLVVIIIDGHRRNNAKSTRNSSVLGKIEDAPEQALVCLNQSIDQMDAHNTTEHDAEGPACLASDEKNMRTIKNAKVEKEIKLEKRTKKQ
jgi:hypothetical protein